MLGGAGVARGDHARLFGVLGDPVEHSLSPAMHNAAFAAARLPHLYLRYRVPIAALAGALREAKALRMGGVNLTVPLKEAVLPLVDAFTAEAERIGAVNTIVFSPDGRLLGDNTDGAGLVRDLTANLGCKLSGARVLLLGAGGAARGIIAPLVEAGVAALEIHNRHPARARALAQELADLAPVRAGERPAPPPPPMPGVFGSTMRVQSADAAAAHRARLKDSGYDLIINATSASLSNELPEIPPYAVGIQTFAYDLAYRDRDTVFVHWARRAGAARAVMGLGMLVEQAAESFLLWRGVRPDTAHVLEALGDRAPKPPPG